MTVDNSGVRQIGFISEGAQLVRIRVLDGDYAGTEVEGSNTLIGKLELDKFFQPNDTALVAMSDDELHGKKFNSLCNYAFSQTTAMNLYHLYSSKGKAGLADKLTTLIIPD